MRAYRWCLANDDDDDDDYDDVGHVEDDDLDGDDMYMARISPRTMHTRDHDRSHGVDDEDADDDDDHFCAHPIAPHKSSGRSYAHVDEKRL